MGRRCAAERVKPAFGGQLSARLLRMATPPKPASPRKKPLQGTINLRPERRRQRRNVLERRLDQDQAGRELNGKVIANYLALTDRHRSIGDAATEA